MTGLTPASCSTTETKSCIHLTMSAGVIAWHFLIAQGWVRLEQRCSRSTIGGRRRAPVFQPWMEAMKCFACDAPSDQNGRAK
ncbi:hypothetical protein ATY41_09500 [Leifsonia xyli subsp. xyli]|uniref:Uncharacterized protein n=1 Tax=Leifsonia xyli subsp. xyli TaxID=59736 RepID=A0A1E2SLL0_LEIXY|nr:hypothetical protein ATY41_09500 [Leifsonia xyli subsp. xyli]